MNDDGKKDYVKRAVRGFTFEQFKELAKDKTLSLHEKIGAPNSYREGYIDEIFEDIIGKLPTINQQNKKIADIGCGCDELAHLLMKKCVDNDHSLYLLDSAEMLNLLPSNDNVQKIAGKFPDEVEDFISQYRNTFDAVLVYSVMHYVTLGDSVFNFVDRAVELLAPNGRLLLGDLPNRTKRKRFFLSPEGIKTHREYTGDPNAIPQVDLFELEYGKLDDAIIFAIMQRYRAAGHETYLLPQADNLPMANRREDILIVKRG